MLARLEVDPGRGLGSSEVPARREEVGFNDLAEGAQRSFWSILWSQIRSPLVGLLVSAAVISLLLGESRDAIAILTIVILNAILGLVQESRAEGAMAALKRLEVPMAKVRRDGQLSLMPARELVPGDIFVLEAGDRVPADGRVLETAELHVLESALTGESEAVTKAPQAPAESRPALGDRTSMVYVGTSVTQGRGLAVVTTTGMRTELGKIAGLLQGVEREPTPIERRLARLSRSLALVALAIVFLVVVLGWIRGEPIRLLLMTALSLAVAAVPEGLLAVATVALALGSRRMLARKALIRRLPSVETLGSVTVICTDKTGTLTRNKMVLGAIQPSGGNRLDLAGADLADADLGGTDPASTDLVRTNSATADVGAPSTLLLEIAALCNDASFGQEPGDLAAENQGNEIGDPTEVALIVGALGLGVDKRALSKRMPRIAEAPFDSQRKRMTTVHKIAGPAAGQWHEIAGESGLVALCKGSVDGLLEVADRLWDGATAIPLDDHRRGLLKVDHDRLAAAGMRVLGFAFKPIADTPPAGAVKRLETGLVFAGMAGLHDPPRQGVQEAVVRCRQAGIRPVMITGDHPVTAGAIARRLGIADGERGIVAGTELERMNEQQLAAVVPDVAVFARVNPEHKLRIVRALQAQGEVVAMTGDGVNDAPALRQADIGLAMGITGTDVAKEAAGMVLLDDRFVTIVDAVEEGRTVYENIRKFIKYTLASNVGEIVVMLVGPFFGLPLPLLPLQILWINLVTDGLPGLALSLEATEPGTMKRPPFARSEGVFDRGLGREVLFVGCLGALVTLSAGLFYWTGPENSQDKWQTVIFTVLTLSQMGNVLAMRSNRDALITRGRRPNIALALAVGLTIALQLAVLYVPVLQKTLGTLALSAADLLLCLGFSAVPMLALEAQKWWRRSRSS